MAEAKRVTVIGPWMFGVISGAAIVVVGLSLLKYYSKYDIFHRRDPFYIFTAAAWLGIWLLWLYIYRRGRRSPERCSQVLKAKS